MRHALIVESRFDIGSLISQHLTVEMGIFCTSFPTAVAAIEYIKKASHEIDVIVVKNFNEEEQTAKMLMNYYYDTKSLPTVVIGNFEFPGMKFETVPDKFTIETLQRKIMGITGITKDEIESHRLPDYIPFPLHYFYLMKKAPCDIFIRIKKKDTDDQFVKRIHAGDETDKEAILRYEQLNLDSLYVIRNDRNLMMDSIMVQAIEKLDSNKDNPDVIIELTSDSFDIVQDLAKKVGISDHTIKLAEGTINSFSRSLEGGNELGPLLKKLLQSKTSYSYKHSFLIAMFAKGVIARLDWGSGAQLEIQFEKMVFVALFHDVTLPVESMLKIRKTKDMAKLSLEDRRIVMEHAHQSGNLIQKFPRAPMGVDVVIRQHHGSSNGLELPERYTNAISPMAITFLVIEEFVESLLNAADGKISIKSALEHLTAEFPLPSYRKVVEALKASIAASVKS